MKQRIVQRISSLILLFALFSCSRKSDDGIIRLDLTVFTGKDVPVAEELNRAIASVRCVGLEGALLGSPHVFFVDDRKCGIQDGNTVYFFDVNTGKMLSSFNRRGRGPEEYLSAWCISYRDGKVCVSDHPDLKKALFYSENGEFVNSIELQDPSILAFFGEDGFVQTYSSFSPKRLSLFRGNEEVRTFNCPSDVRDTPVVSFGGIMKGTGNIYSSPLSDTLYRASYDKVEPYMVLDKGQYSVPDEKRGEIDAGIGYINEGAINFAGRLAFISAHYRLPQYAVVDLESGKLLYKITASIDNREPGIPVDCDGETLQIRPDYCTGNTACAFVQKEESTMLVVLDIR